MYREKVMVLFGMSPTVSGGKDFAATDDACGGIASKAVENCTKPLFQKVGDAKQRAWVLGSDDYPWDVCVGSEIKTPDGIKWYYNFQNGDKCVYINDNRFPNPQNK